MPSYFYHLTFELYPTPNPTAVGPTIEPRRDIWLPPKQTNVFDELPAHPKRERPSGVRPAYRNSPPPASASVSASVSVPSSSVSARGSQGEGATPSVIDCGASRIPARENKRIEIISERKWRERTKSFPPPPSSAAIRPQTAVRDWRFGRVNIESVDIVKGRGEDRNMNTNTDPSFPTSSHTMAADGQNPNQNPNAAAFAALELGPTLGGDGSTTRAECVSLPTKNTEVGWGVVHFYRGEEMPNLDVPSGSGTGGLKDDECTTLCIPAVPSYILPADFLGFVGEKWREDVTHFRMVMTSRMSRYLVLIKFRDGKKAKEWQKEFNGKVFNSMVSQICHVVFVKSINFETPNQPHDSKTEKSLFSSYSLKPFPPPTPNLIELPTCPVCLERMDDTNGLMTIPCQHVFHCICLQNWTGSGCPVCRYTSPSHNDPTSAGDKPFGSSTSNLCAVCDTTEDLWICLICGHVGCGRYKGGHAKEHWKETAHSFSLEIETQHVWDYAGDTWVHRLIRAKGDGKVVELPSHNREGGTSPMDDDVVPRAKVEAMGLEYTHLLTSQLESQRVYFEEKIAQAADKAHTASVAAESAAAQARAATERLSLLEEKYHELRNETVPQLERDLERERHKAAKAHDLARRLGRDLQDEKQMTKGLNEKVTHLQGMDDTRKSDIEKLQREKAELEDMNRDLTMFISGQEKLKELEEEGKVEREELEEGSTSVGTKGNRRRGPRK